MIYLIKYKYDNSKILKIDKCIKNTDKKILLLVNSKKAAFYYKSKYLDKKFNIVDVKREWNGLIVSWAIDELIKNGENIICYYNFVPMIDASLKEKLKDYILIIDKFFMPEENYYKYLDKKPILDDNGKKIINKRFVRKCIKNDIVYFRYEPFSGEDVCNVNHYNEGERRLCENDALILHFGLQIINLPKNIIESFNDVFFFTKYAVDKFEKEFVYFDIKYKKANV